MKPSAETLMQLEERAETLFNMFPAQEIAAANSALDKLINLDFSKMNAHFKSRLAEAKDLKDLKSLKADIEEYIKDGRAIENDKMSNTYVAFRKIINFVASAGLFLIPFVGIASMTAFLVKRSKDLDKIKANIAKSLPKAEEMLKEVKQKIERMK